MLTVNIFLEKKSKNDICVVINMYLHKSQNLVTHIFLVKLGIFYSVDFPELCQKLLFEFFILGFSGELFFWKIRKGATNNKRNMITLKL